MLSHHRTDGIPPQYWIPSSVLMISLNITDGLYPSTELNTYSLKFTDCIFTPYCWWCFSTVLMVTQHWTTSILLLVSLYSTDSILHITELQHPPIYWLYSPQYRWLLSTEHPPFLQSTRWSPFTVLLISPSVFKVFSQKYWWQPSTLLSPLYCTDGPSEWISYTLAGNRNLVGMTKCLGQELRNPLQACHI